MGERQILRTSSYLTLLAELKKERLMDLMDDEIMGKMSTDSQQERRELLHTVDFCEKERARLITSDDVSSLEDHEAEAASPINTETKRGDLEWPVAEDNLDPSRNGTETEATPRTPEHQQGKQKHWRDTKGRFALFILKESKKKKYRSMRHTVAQLYPRYRFSEDWSEDRCYRYAKRIRQDVGSG